MTTRLLTSSPDRDRPAQDLAPGLGPGLALARVHEACGPARRTLAAWLAGRMRGPVIWIAPSWEKDRLNPDGLLAFADPARFLFVAPRRAEDLLWACEEALRAGAAPLVVADLPGAPALTPVRRMHLAAETARDSRGLAPLGLLLTPGTGGAQGVETRWHMAPAHGHAERAWHLTRARARTAPVCQWKITRQAGKMQAAPLAASLPEAPGEVPAGARGDMRAATPAETKGEAGTEAQGETGAAPRLRAGAEPLADAGGQAVGNGTDIGMHRGTGSGATGTG
ncbi:ImuA family protein [Marinibacterium sp. SX1]|uniref:ImuA family protein n=1 Tax=Marinibacterium sp. SX1 TaxID=3388424 RepID=UPI003D17645A